MFDLVAGTQVHYRSSISGVYDIQGAAQISDCFYQMNVSLFHSFEMNFDIPRAPLCIISRSEVLPVSQIFVWLHWKHDFT